MNEILLNFSCASVATVLSALVSYPLDTIKSNMQYDDKKYKGLLRSTYIMYKEYGIRGFFRGFYSDLGIMIVHEALAMINYEYMLKSLDKNSNNKYLNVFVSGCFCEIPLLITLVPLEYIKVLQQCEQPDNFKTGINNSFNDSSSCKNQTQIKANSTTESNNKPENNLKFKSFKEKAREVLNHKGFPGLFRGFWVTFNRDFISSGVYFLSYYSLKKISFLKLNSESTFDSLLTYGLSGGIAGGISWLVSHPIDTIKTVIQMGDLKENTLKQKEVIEKLCQEGYLKGIIRSYRGGLSSVLCTMVGCSTFFIIYEFMKIELKL